MPLPEIPRDRSADFPQSLLREVSRRGAEFAGLLRDLAPAAALAALVVGGLALGLGIPVKTVLMLALFCGLALAALSGSDL